MSAYAPIAQLDRVTGYEPVGRGFESLSAYQKKRMLRHPLFLVRRKIGLERAAPVRTLVQKLRAGEQFLARGRVHRRKTHPVWGDGFLLFLFHRQIATSPFQRTFATDCHDATLLAMTCFINLQCTSKKPSTFVDGFQFLFTLSRLPASGRRSDLRHFQDRSLSGSGLRQHLQPPAAHRSSGGGSQMPGADNRYGNPPHGSQ